MVLYQYDMDEHPKVKIHQRFPKNLNEFSDKEDSREYTRAFRVANDLVIIMGGNVTLKPSNHLSPKKFDTNEVVLISITIGLRIQYPEWDSEPPSK
jgi:hypothetical protein